MTQDLPRALEPWKTSLAIFPPDIASAVGDVVARLSVLLGPLEQDRASPHGEPDGVAGIGRRGPFDRLLATEWALLDEVPDEFLRRAAEQTLSFYEIARREPSADRRCVVLFDAGSDQLGAPRVVHLAALILLAQRALDARARFAWGILQDDISALREVVTGGSALGLVRGRRREPATDADAARWGAALRAQPRARGAPAAGQKREEVELWIVGGPRTPDPIPSLPHPRIVVDDVLDPEHLRSVDVSVLAPRRPRRAARLELPPVDTAVRLLRNPFVVEPIATRVTAARLGPGALPFVFAWNGRKLFARGDGGSTIAITIDSSAIPRVYAPPPSDTILAIGQIQRKQRTVILVRTAKGLAIEHLAKKDRAVSSTLTVHDAEGLELGGSPGDPLDALFPVSYADTLVLHRRRLLRLHHGQAAGTKASSGLIAPASIAFRGGAAHVVVLTAETDPRLLKCWIDPQGLVVTTEIEAFRAVAARLAMLAMHPRMLVGPGMIAFMEDPDVYRVCHTAYESNPDQFVGPRIAVARGDLVVGVASSEGPAMVVVDPDRRRVELVGEDGKRRRLVEVKGGIRHAQASPYGPHVAVLGHSGGLDIRPLAENAVAIARFEIGAAP